MPVSFLSVEQRENYGNYMGVPSPHDLARYFHLDDADHALIAQKRGKHSRLGFAVQLGTVRYLGIFLEDPLAVPLPVLHGLAKQLRIDGLDGIRDYSASRQRYQQAAEIRAHYGYVEINERTIGFRLTRWLYALCWTGTDRPSVLFERATAWLVTHRVLLPGATTLERYVARLRARVEERLWLSLGRDIGDEQQARLESLLAVPLGSRNSALDRLRTGPVTVSSPALVLALQRLRTVRELGHPVAGDGAHSGHASGGPGAVRRRRQGQRHSAFAESAAVGDAGRVRALPGSERTRRCIGGAGSAVTRLVRQCC